MSYLLFVVYLLLFAWLVTRTRFFQATGLSKSQLIILFFLKVIAGIFYGWMGVYYGGTAQMLDTWNFHKQSLLEYQLLWNHPAEYFTNIFHSGYPEGYANFFASSDSYWNDLKSNIFIKFLSVLDIFSFGHYYINVIFYSFISFFGPVAIYRVMKQVFPEQKTALLLSVFLIPSFFYWASGIHKEGLLFLGIGLIVYHSYFGYRQHHFSFKRWGGILLGLLLLLLLRNFLLMLILPALFAWWLAQRRPQFRRAIFFGLYTGFLLLFFTLRYIDSRLDFPQVVVNKQQAFIKIVGHSSIPIKELEPNALSFLLKTPQALTLSAVRPYPSDIRHLPSLFAAIETDGILLLFLLFLLFPRRSPGSKDPVIYFGIFFSISLLLTIGFSVNNLGAIVRYRSIIIPLLVTPMMVQTDWKKLFDLFLSRSKKTGMAPGND